MGLVYSFLIWAALISVLAVYVYLVDYRPEGSFPYTTDESMIQHYLGEGWIWFARAKHWLGARQIWLETGALLFGVLGALFGKWPLTKKK